MTDGVMECRGIGKVFEGDRVALDDINFSIPTTGIFALIGRNGAGKTTLTRILSTLLEPSAGKATIDGLDVMEDAQSLRDRMAVVPQEGRSIPWMTPMQMTTTYLLWRGMGYREAKKRAAEAIGQVGLSDHADTLGRKLSGGMKRKSLVAMVLASGADLIFLDEPSTGLDPLSRRDLWELLTTLGRDRFLFITTHYLEEAEAIADRIGILDRGRMLALGSMDELRAGLGYQYVLRAPPDTNVPEHLGEVMVGLDGQVQVLTTQEGSMRLSRELIERNAPFTVNPVTLEEIFYRLAGRGISMSNGEEQE